MSYTNPQQSDFQTLFYRDFNFGSDPNNSVTPTDIANAFAKTNVNINPAIFPDQASYNLGYLYLSAHYLVLALRASSQGINGQWNWAQAGKSVGAVSETFQIPQRMIDNPELMYLTKTNYGVEYLIMILPVLTGQMFAVYGGTNP